MGTEIFEEIAQQASEKLSGEQSRENSQEAESNKSDESSPDQAQGSPSDQAIFDLDKAKEIMFEGRKLTLKELKDSVLMHRDYTNKTREIAREREQIRYYEKLQNALDDDLETVRNDPSKAELFKQIYPESFHKYLRHVLPKEAQSQAGNQNVEAVIENLLSKRLGPVEEQLSAQRVQAKEAEIAAIREKFSSKYPYASEEEVYARARIANENNVPLTPEVWEKIHKDIHDRHVANYQQQYSKQVKEQQSANLKAKDVAPGGGVPGGAPKKTSFDEATKNAIRELSSRH